MELLTTHDAAAVLGVGTTSIKRWADEGVLRCVRTPGGHRRYPRDAVHALRDAPLPSGGLTHSWLQLLLDGSVDAIAARLRAERAKRGSWAAVADRLGPVLAELGHAWARGDISVIDEHVASDRLSRALAQCAASCAVAATAPRALLVTAEGEDHTLGLSLLELCLRELGWAAIWAGRRSPIAHVAAYLRADNEIALVGVSASEAMRDPIVLGDQARVLADACRSRGAQLVVGGAGAWPDPPPPGIVVRSFVELAGHAAVGHPRDPTRPRRRPARPPIG